MNRLIALAIFLSLSGCQSTSQPTPDAQSAPKTVAPAGSQASFSQDSMYALLVAEIAGQRNRFDIALNNYVDQAKKTQDPAVAERAFRIAEYLEADQDALDMSLIWANRAPTNIEAQRAAAIQLARSGQYDQSMAFMERVLAGHGDTHFDFLALSAAETDQSTRSALLGSFERLLQKHPDNSQLVFGKALLLQQDGRDQEALALLNQKADEQQGIPTTLLHTRLLQSMGKSEEALPVLRKSLEHYPNDKRLRVTYARLLLENNQIEQSISEFAGLLQRYPSDDELRLTLALVYLEANAPREAIINLEDLLVSGNYPSAAYLNLGRAHEALGQTRQAVESYQAVAPSNEYLPAQLLLTQLLFRQGRGAEAQSWLKEQRQHQPELLPQLYLIEVDVLAQSDQQEEAWTLINQALLEIPNDTSLLYTRALLAESRGDLALLESDLRIILANDPNNAMALNALGYTLADRTHRYQEALELIERAYQINPDDPATLDSLGWVYYKLGRYQEAERFLKQAYALMPDDEVAAHLGEALWASGKHREAKQIWQNALRKYPDSPVITETTQRLNASESRP